METAEKAARVSSNGTGNAKGKPKERSPNYPSMTITDAVESVTKLYNVEKRTTVSPEVAAKALGFGALSGPARQALATLRQYGLIEGGAAGTKVSDLAFNIIVHPADSSERTEAIKQAAINPPLIAELARTHWEASDDAIKAYLRTAKNFSEDGAGRFLGAFRDAIKLANLGASGYVGSDGGGGKPKDTARQTPPTKPPGERMEFTWPLSGDVVATLTVSRAIEADDIETLSDYFEIAKKALGKAAARASAANVAGSTSESDASRGI